MQLLARFRARRRELLEPRYGVAFQFEGEQAGVHGSPGFAARFARDVKQGEQQEPGAAGNGKSKIQPETIH
jgi:hypothetical protein